MKTTMDKGHKNQFQRLIQLVKKGGEALIPIDNIINGTSASFAAIESLKENKWIDVG